MRMPAPSPVSESHPQAPRCARLTRIWRPFRTMSWEAWPLIFTTKPMPHASCSFAGSYRPWDCGSWEAVSTEYTAHSPLGLGGSRTQYSDHPSIRQIEFARLQYRIYLC